MKPRTLFASLFVLSGFILHAQGLPGTYVHKSTAGEISISFETPFQNAMKGLMIDEQGAKYTLEGTTSDESTVKGTLSASQGGSMYFQAQVQGNALTFFLIPVASDQSPDYQNASQYTFQRKEVSISSLQPGSVGGGMTGGPIGGLTQPSSGWSGTFSGTIYGSASTLQLQEKGTQVEGKIDASGYIYTISGSVNGMQSQGQIKDSKTGGVMNYSATLQGDHVSMNLIVQDQFGQSSQVPLSFSRGSRTQSPQPGFPSPSNPSVEGNQAGTAQNVQRDQRLVGGWRHTESYSDATSGFGMVSEWYLTINMDGTYVYGDGQVAGGGSGYSCDSGQGGSTSRGQWKTENGVIYINEGYGWQAYAGYYVEGNSMMFKFNDGSNQLWERFR